VRPSPIIAALIAALILAVAIGGPPRWMAALTQERMPPPARAETAPGPMPEPPPHVIVMQSDQGTSRFLRRGGWMRQERALNGASLIHMTGPGGHSFALVLSAERAPLSMQLNRADTVSAEGVRTGATDTALGERCEIWERASVCRTHLWRAGANVHYR
jgi:hypothetical protein